MSDRLYENFVRQWEEVTRVPPQTMGPLTPVYKHLVTRLKDKPWLAFFIVSLMTVVIAYILIGSAVVAATSLLQRGI